MDAKVMGLNNVLKNLNREIKRIKGRSAAGLYAAAMHVRRESVKRAPIVTGNLRRTAYVVGSTGQSFNRVNDKLKPEEGHEATVSSQMSQVRGKIEPEARVGYSAVYALSVHENPRAGKTGGISPSGRVISAGLTTKGNKSNRKMYATRGEWKFLENPLKESAREIVNIIKDFAVAGRKL